MTVTFRERLKSQSTDILELGLKICYNMLRHYEEIKLTKQFKKLLKCEFCVSFISYHRKCHGCPWIVMTGSHCSYTMNPYKNKIIGLTFSKLRSGLYDKVVMQNDKFGIIVWVDKRIRNLKIWINRYKIELKIREPECTYSKVK